MQSTPSSHKLAHHAPADVPLTWKTSEIDEMWLRAPRVLMLMLMAYCAGCWRWWCVCVACCISQIEKHSCISQKQSSSKQQALLREGWPQKKAHTHTCACARDRVQCSQCAHVVNKKNTHTRKKNQNQICVFSILFGYTLYAHTEHMHLFVFGGCGSSAHAISMKSCAYICREWRAIRFLNHTPQR